jgi:hypothetical protein
MPRGEESQDCLLPSAFLTAFLTALLANLDQFFPGDSFFQLRQFSQKHHLNLLGSMLL